MNIKQANQQSLVKILNRLNAKQTICKEDDIWFLSPFRQEKTASFHVKPSENVWYDHGEGKGGDCVSFAVHYLKSQGEDYTVSDALRWLKNMSGFVSPVPIVAKATKERSPAFTMKCKTTINTAALTNYLDSRGIPLDIAKDYLSEVYFDSKKTGKHYYALGFKNLENGYEFRNPVQQGCIGIKAISFIRGTIPKPEEIHVFEGVFDFLSVITKLNGTALKGDAIILNSVSMVNHLYPYVRNYGYKIAYTWFDNDEAGTKAKVSVSDYFKAENIQHIAMNTVYKNFKDVNEWLVNSPQSTLKRF